MKASIAVLEGDGIGPEIMTEALKILDSVAIRFGHHFEFQPAPFGADAYFEFGSAFPDRSKTICDSADAILKGPAGLSLTEMRRIPVDQRPEIDRWALALMNQTIKHCTEAMDNYDAKSAGDTIEAFIDQLSNWYVRRNRRRFWKSTDPEDKHSAYLTLYQCLNIAHRLMAPFVPFLSEHVYQNLVRGADKKAPLSVHMSDWPSVNEIYDNDQLLFDIGIVQKVVGLARAASAQSGWRARVE